MSQGEKIIKARESVMMRFVKECLVNQVKPKRIVEELKACAWILCAELTDNSIRWKLLPRNAQIFEVKWE